MFEKSLFMQLLFIYTAHIIILHVRYVFLKKFKNLGFTELIEYFLNFI